MGASASSSSVLAESEWMLSGWRLDERADDENAMQSSSSSSTSSQTNSISCIGISFSGLMKVAGAARASLPLDSRLTTRQVVEEWILQHESVRRGKSLVECPDLVDPKDLGPPSYYVIHTWDASFSSLINTIDSFLSSKGSNIRVWIDLISLPLTKMHSRSFHQRQEDTRAAISLSRCGAIVALDSVCMPFTQAWCLHEMDLVIRSHGPDSIHIPLLSHGPTSSPDHPLLQKIIESIDLATSAATKNDHLEGIKQMAKNNHGSISAFSSSLRLHLLMRPISHKTDLSRHLMSSRSTSWDLSGISRWLVEPFNHGQGLFISSDNRGGRSATAATIWEMLLGSGRPSDSSFQLFPALHLVRRDDLRRFQPAQMIKSLAFQLVERSRLPGLLLPPHHAIQIFEDLEEEPESHLIPLLTSFASHLSFATTSSPSSSNQQYSPVPPQVIILIDGLEEALDEVEGQRSRGGGGGGGGGGEEEVCGILRFLVQAVSLLPLNVRFILTVNESSTQATRLRHLISCTFSSVPHLANPDSRDLIDFVTLDQLISDPESSPHLFKREVEYEIALGPLLVKKDPLISDLINLMLSSFEPLPIALLDHMGLYSSFTDLLAADIIVIRDGGRVSFADVGLRGWLVSHAGSTDSHNFLSSVDINAGHALLSSHLLDQELLPWLGCRPSHGSLKVSSLASEYGLKFLFRHICLLLSPSSSAPDVSSTRQREGLARLERALRSWELIEQIFLSGHGEMGLVRPLNRLCLHNQGHTTTSAHQGGKPMPFALGHYPRECLRWLHACKTAFKRKLGSSSCYGSKGSDVIEVVTMNLCPASSIKHREAEARFLALRSSNNSPRGSVLSSSLIHSHVLGEEGSDWPPMAVPFSSMEGEAEASCVVYSSDGSLLASSFHTGLVEVCSLGSRRRILRLQGGGDDDHAHGGGGGRGVERVGFSPDGTILASVGGKGMLFWDLASGACLSSLQGSRCLAFGPQGQLAACSATNHTATIYYFKSTTTQSPREDSRVKSTPLMTPTRWTDAPCGSVTLHGHHHHVKVVAISPDGKVAATGSSDGTAKLWALPPGPANTEGMRLSPRSNLLGHGGWVSSIAFSHDSKMVATAGGLDGKIQVWFVISGTLSSTLYHREGLEFDPNSSTSSPLSQPPLMNGDVSCVTFGPSFGGSSLLASAGDDGMVRLWNLNYCPRASIGEFPRSICFLTLPHLSLSTPCPSPCPSPSPTFPTSPTSPISPTSPSNQTSTANHGPLSNHSEVSHSEVSHVTFSPCGRFVATSSANGSIREFDIEDHLRAYRLSIVATSHIMGSINDGGDGGPAASISPWYESPSPGHQNWQALSQRGSLRGSMGNDYGAASPRVSMVGNRNSQGGYGGMGGRVGMGGSSPLPNGGSCTAVSKSEALPGPDQHTKGVTALSFNPQAKRGTDGGGAGYGVGARSSKTGVLSGDKQPLLAPGGSFLATASADCTCRLWHLDSVRCVAVMLEHKGALTGVAWSPDSRYIATCSTDCTALVYDVSYVIELCLKGQVQGVEVGGCKQVASLTGHEDEVTDVAWSPRGRGVLVTGSKDGSIKFWDVSNKGVGALCTVTLYGAHLVTQGGVAGLSYSPDGGLLASVGTDRYLKVWDMTTDELISNVMAPFEDEFIGVAFIDSKCVATCMRKAKEVKVWDTQSKQVVAVLRGHTRGVLSIVLSPDGQLLGSAGSDMTARVWSTSDWKCVETIQGHNDWVLSMAFADKLKGEGEGGTQKVATGCKATQVKLASLNL